MAGINVGRWFFAGVCAGILIWILEGVGSFLYMADMLEELQAHGLAMELTFSTWLLSIAVSLLAGLALVFFYAAARPRFGAGPKTAVIVAVALWLGSYVVSLIGYHMLGLFPATMLVTWAAIGLVEMILAGLLGGALYREA
jgi:hypothetical protein